MVENDAADKRARSLADARRKSAEAMRPMDGSAADNVSTHIVQCRDGVAWWAINRFTGESFVGFVPDKEV